MMHPGVLPPVYFLTALAAMAVLHLAVPGARVLSFPWNLWGCLPLALGIVFNLVADAAFKRYGTTVKPFRESTTLVTTGVFRIARHPMYLGMVLILAGTAGLLGSLTPFLVVFLFAFLMDRTFVRAEERMLAERFPAAWAVYRGRVRRWI